MKCPKLAIYRPILMKLGTQTKMNMLSSHTEKVMQTSKNTNLEVCCIYIPDKLHLLCEFYVESFKKQQILNVKNDTVLERKRCMSVKF
jgi:hypothetical protein